MYPSTYMQELKTLHKCRWSTMFIRVLVTRAKLRKQLRGPTLAEWIKKTWYLYVMKHYSDIKKDEMMPSAGKWMELEVNMLSEVSQAQKDKGLMFSFICGS
jgi:hypothetical protein